MSNHALTLKIFKLVFESSDVRCADWVQNINSNQVITTQNSPRVTHVKFPLLLCEKLYQ